jgi:uncharacterized protein (TIGR03435 family)
VLAGQVDRDEVYRLVRQAIEKYFRFTMTVEDRPMDVYVMTAADGKSPKGSAGEESCCGGFWSEWVELEPHGDTPPTIETLRKIASAQKPSGIGISQISAFNTTMDAFRGLLEQALNRPILDETNLKDRYDIAVQGKARNTGDFLQMLSDEAGIVLTPAKRNIEMLVVSQLP